MTADWRVYEEAARKVLSDIRRVLGLENVEGKQLLGGKSGTQWEIDAKAWCEDSDRFMVVEVRRHTTAGLKQEELAAIAYRVEDLGSSGGIVVSPLPLQQGAKLVAASANIQHVRLSSGSTTEAYLAEYMGQRFHGLTLKETVKPTATIEAVVIRAKSDDP